MSIILTNSDNYVRNIKIRSNHEACKSDLYAITFSIKLKIERIKPLKAKTEEFQL